jgi:hypothetical protein
VPTTVGATIPAAQVLAARTAGAHVYVSPNGSGDGLVVAAGKPLPQALVADYAASGAGTAATTTTDETARAQKLGAMLMALMDADIPVVSVHEMGTYSGGKNIQSFWTIGIDGVPNFKTINGGLPHEPTHAAAVAAAQKLAAQYGAEVVDAD